MIVRMGSSPLVGKGIIARGSQRLIAIVVTIIDMADIVIVRGGWIFETRQVTRLLVHGICRDILSIGVVLRDGSPGPARPTLARKKKKKLTQPQPQH